MPRADVPRIGCAEHGVLQATTPWSKPDSRFPALIKAVAIDRPNDAAESMHARIQRIKRMACGSWSRERFRTRSSRISADWIST